MEQLNSDQLAILARKFWGKYDKIAELSGVSYGTVSNFFRGFSKNPTVAKVVSDCIENPQLLNSVNPHLERIAKALQEV